MTRKRPLLVTVLAIYFLGCGLISPLLIVSPQQSTEELVQQGGAIGFLASHLGASGITALTFVLLLYVGVVGWGLWRLRPWGRLGAMSISGVWVCGGIVYLIGFIVSKRYFEILIILLVMATLGFPLFYFSRAKIKELFSSQN